MRETIAKKIPGRRQQVVNYLHGLGPVPVISTSTLKTVCNINDINEEILFHVLSDFEMTTNVLIGSDLLCNTGLSEIETLNTATLVSQPQIMHVRSNSSIFSNLNHVLCDQSEIDKLMTLLNNYSYLFTSGFAKTRVNTGQLKIRFIRIPG